MKQKSEPEVPLTMNLLLIVTNHLIAIGELSSKLDYRDLQNT